MLKNADNRIDPKYIDVLDGMRALSIIIVLIFHFWQQTWIWPVLNTPFLHFIGIDSINISNLATVGYVFVDAMVLISGFLLFLPIARQVLLGESEINWKQYAKKRLARILPSYLFSVLFIFIFFAIPSGAYKSSGAAILDLVSHITFTQTLWYSTYIGTELNVALWTVAIEVWFYILFPFIAKFINIKSRKKEKSSPAPALIRSAIVYVVMLLIAYFYIYKITLSGKVYLGMYINQLPAFMGVYANGMAGAFLFVAIAKYHKRNIIFNIFSTLLAGVFLYLIVYFVNDCATLSSDLRQAWQVTERFKLSLAYLGFIISAALSVKWFRWLLSNRLMRFLSTISFNLYIWHQWLAVQLKLSHRFPYWEGVTPPNQLGDTVWMREYAAIITVAAFVVAIAATYLIEKPLANIIMGKPAFRKAKPKRIASAEGESR